jgi:uncharacterized protein (TIGR02145 family)
MFKRIFKTSVFIACIAIVFSSCRKDDDKPTSMTDQDGNVYKIVTIGTQTWMAEDLRTTKYNDGTPITNVTGASEWAVLTTGAYCNYNNTTNTDTLATYGRLYNWYAVNTNKLAPKGWHVATDDEWTVLTDSLEGKETAGGKLKETGLTHWCSPNYGATNETGFTALPGGYRDLVGTFYSIGNYGYWWSATESNTGYVWYRGMACNLSSVYRNYNNKVVGFSVRCVKD